MPCWPRLPLVKQLWGVKLILLCNLSICRWEFKTAEGRHVLIPCMTIPLKGKRLFFSIYALLSLLLFNQPSSERYESYHMTYIEVISFSYTDKNVAKVHFACEIKTLIDSMAIVQKYFRHLFQCTTAIIKFEYLLVINEGQTCFVLIFSWQKNLSCYEEGQICWVLTTWTPVATLQQGAGVKSFTPSVYPWILHNNPIIPVPFTSPKVTSHSCPSENISCYIKITPITNFRVSNRSTNILK